MASPQLEPPKPSVGGLLVTEVLDGFLDWTKTHRADRTFDSYLERLQSFCDYLAAENLDALSAKELRPFHVQEWVDSHSTWNPGMKRGRMQAVQRAFNWAVKLGRLDRSPIRFLEKPPQGKRENFITLEQFKKLIDGSNHAFADLLNVAWETGARPQELLRLAGHHLAGD